MSGGEYVRYVERVYEFGFWDFLYRRVGGIVDKIE